MRIRATPLVVTGVVVALFTLPLVMTAVGRSSAPQRDSTAADPSPYHVMPAFDAPDPNFQIWHSKPGAFDYTGVWVGWSFGRMTIAPGTPNLGQNALVGWRSPVTSSVEVLATIFQN